MWKFAQEKEVAEMPETAAALHMDHSRIQSPIISAMAPP